MGIGAERAEAPSPDVAVAAHPTPTFDYIGEAYAYREAEADPGPERPGRTLAILLALAAAGWLGAVGWLALGGSGADLDRIALLISLASGPLVLIGLAWLAFGRTARRETERYREAVSAMQRESMALESVLAIVAGRLEENRARLGEESGRLMSLGEEAADRLGRVTHYLSRESASLDARAAALEAAAANARVDLGVLMHDLPRAETQASAVADAMKRAGLEAHGQAGALEGQLAALTARGREADEVVGGAAQRLGAHLARIETNAAAAGGRIDESAAAMKLAVDEAMARAADTMDASRAALDAQSAGVLAAIEHNRSLLDRTGADAADGLRARLDAVVGQMDTLATQLAAQDRTSRDLVAYLTRELDGLDARLAALSQSGEAGARMLNDGFSTVRACANHLFEELQTGHGRAGALIDRAQSMAEGLAGILHTLDDTLPVSLARIEEQALVVRGAAAQIAPEIEAAGAAADATAGRIATLQAANAGQDEAAAAAAARLSDAARTVETQLQALTAAVAEIDQAAARTTQSTAPALIEALLRVRDTAGVAADRAREAIGAIIPETAEQMAAASRAALADALAGPIAEQMDAVGDRAVQAVEAAQAASARLTRQLVTIGEAAVAVDRRIAEARAERDAELASEMPGRVSLLIESLNSAAIDVTKILSNDVTDSAWAAYLKGDRGVFTRRAVRLLDAVEAREILRHYEDEPEFRDQVNRYVLDFETLLKRILADPDGSALGVTILSSDMGKLYVALAQAIERLR